MESAVGESEVKIGDWSIRLYADSAVAECQRTTSVNEIEGEQAIAFGPDMKHPGVGLILADCARAALAPGWLPWAQKEDRRTVAGDDPRGNHATGWVGRGCHAFQRRRTVRRLSRSAYPGQQ
jgi:hypothetical protein